MWTSPPRAASRRTAPPPRNPSRRSTGAARRSIAAALLGCTAAVLAACAGPADAPGPTAAPGSGAPAVSGSFDPSAASQLFEPTGASSAGVPLIVLVPGGGWTSADPAGLTGLATWLSEHGAAVVTVTYRTATDGAYFPAPAQDITCDLADAVRLAGQHGITVGDVVLVGHSAGAQLAAVVALTPEPYSAECGAGPVAPDRFVGLAGPYDVRQVGPVTAAIFGPQGQDPAGWTAGNPVELAAERPDLPVLLIHGAADDVVPPAFTEQFASALEAAGHPVTVRYPDGVDHQSVYSAEVAGPLVAGWLGLPG